MATCVIVQGELLFMAHHSQRAAENRAVVRAFVNAIRIHPVDGETADLYG
jgi:tRNA(fMet)-specific endonuclease VapC